MSARMVSWYAVARARLSVIFWVSARSFSSFSTARPIASDAASSFVRMLVSSVHFAPASTCFFWIAVSVRAV